MRVHLFGQHLYPPIQLLIQETDAEEDDFLPAAKIGLEILHFFD